MCIYVSTAANVVQCAIGIKNGCKYILSSCFVNFSVGGLPSYLIWLDASDIAMEGTWIWMATNEVVTYTNWRTGEPSNTGHNEDCLRLYTHQAGLWNDVPCDVNCNSICEIEY